VRKTFVTKQDLNDTLQGLRDSFMTMCKSLKTFTKEVDKKLLEKINANDKQAEERVKTVADTLSRLGKTLTSRLMLDLENSLQGVRQEVKELMESLGSVQQMMSQRDQVIQRLDEVLLDKASKVDLQKTNLQFSEYYRKTDVDKRFLAVNVSSAESSEELNMLQERVDELRGKLDEVKVKLEAPKLEQVEYRVIKQHVQEIKTSLTHKADRAEMLSLIESKVGVEVLDLTLEELDLNKRHTQMTAVMLLTTLRGLYTVGRDSMTSELKRREHLIAQVENLVSWIGRHKSEKSSSPKKGVTLPSIDNSYSL
jgi:6-pyruvoyl-tetrahydropterin synthase